MRTVCGLGRRLQRLVGGTGRPPCRSASRRSARWPGTGARWSPTGSATSAGAGRGWTRSTAPPAAARCWSPWPPGPIRPRRCAWRGSWAATSRPAAPRCGPPPGSPSGSAPASTPGRSRCTASPPGSGRGRWAPRRGGWSAWLRRHAPAAGPYRVRLVDDSSPADLTDAIDRTAAALAAGRPVPLLVGAFVAPALRARAGRRTPAAGGCTSRPAARSALVTRSAARPRRSRRSWASPAARGAAARLTAQRNPSGPERRLVRVTDTLPTRTVDLPAQWTPGDVEAGMYQRWVDAGYFTADVDERQAAVQHRHPAAQRHRQPAHRARVRAHADRHPGPAPPHAGLRDALAARHGPRLDRGARAGRAGAGAEGAPAAASWAGRRSSSAPGSGRPSTAARSWPRCAGSARAWTGPASGSPWTRAPNRAVLTIFKRLYDDGLIYRAERMVNWSPEDAQRALATSRSSTARSRASWSPSATATATTRSSWPPPASRRCSATPRSPCTPTTSATRTWSAARSSCRWSGA